MKKKTSITIDILGEKSYNELSEWRKDKLVRRARRVLPLPISLTTDDKIGYVWKQRYLNSLSKKYDSSALKKNNNSSIPHFIKMMIDQDEHHFKTNFPDLYTKYMNIVSKEHKSDNSSKEKSVSKLYFPFMEILDNHYSTDSKESVLNEIKWNQLIDEDYENYVKHNELLQYFASNLKNIHSRDYDSEIDGWASQLWLRKYGYPDPTIPPSKVPCSGCGAHLHCTATNIPGFVPVQKFTLYSENELQTLICQRCEFLKKYNVALNVNVSSDEYPNLISKIQSQKSLVIILVDLLDFPCSVWPGIINLIGENHKIYLVGNKVDLLPKDDQFYLERIRKSLKETLKTNRISKNTKIRDISLISAKTGFGVEELVSKLFRDIKPGYDIYLIGCTNSGKSTLFNVFMQTDLCSNRESDLLNRATTSVWPGTTLNLLKFPIRKLTGWENEMRLKQLNKFMKEKVAEHRIKRATLHPKKYSQLSNRMDLYLSNETPYIMNEDHPLSKKNIEKKPFNLDSAKSKNCNFLHDTPGVIYKDQILNLLSTEELLRTIPREIITPRTYTLRPGQTLFIGGLARIDVSHARQNVWLTVFASQYLPVNIVYTEQAKKFYETHVGTDFLSVPIGNEERLKYWPILIPKEFSIKCIGWEESCADIVLSSVGWVAITGSVDSECTVRAFTPEGRGIYQRTPPVLSFAARLKGKRILNTPCFENKLFTIDQMTRNTSAFFKDRNQHFNEHRLKRAIDFIK